MYTYQSDAMSKIIILNEKEFTEYNFLRLIRISPMVSDPVKNQICIKCAQSRFVHCSSSVMCVCDVDCNPDCIFAPNSKNKPLKLTLTHNSLPIPFMLWKEQFCKEYLNHLYERAPFQLHDYYTTEQYHYELAKFNIPKAPAVPTVSYSWKWKKICQIWCYDNNVSDVASIIAKYLDYKNICFCGNEVQHFGTLIEQLLPNHCQECLMHIDYQMQLTSASYDFFRHNMNSYVPKDFPGQFSMNSHKLRLQTLTENPVGAYSSICTWNDLYDPGWLARLQFRNNVNDNNFKTFKFIHWLCSSKGAHCYYGNRCNKCGVNFGVVTTLEQQINHMNNCINLCKSCYCDLNNMSLLQLEHHQNTCINNILDDDQSFSDEKLTDYSSISDRKSVDNDLKNDMFSGESVRSDAILTVPKKTLVNTGSVKSLGCYWRKKVYCNICLERRAEYKNQCYECYYVNSPFYKHRQILDKIHKLQGISPYIDDKVSIDNKIENEVQPKKCDKCTKNGKFQNLDDLFLCSDCYFNELNSRIAVKTNIPSIDQPTKPPLPRKRQVVQNIINKDDGLVSIPLEYKSFDKDDGVLELANTNLDLMDIYMKSVQENQKINVLLAKPINSITSEYIQLSTTEFGEQKFLCIDNPIRLNYFEWFVHMSEKIIGEKINIYGGERINDIIILPRRAHTKIVYNVGHEKIKVDLCWRPTGLICGNSTVYYDLTNDCDIILQTENFLVCRVVAYRDYLFSTVLNEWWHTVRHYLTLGYLDVPPTFKLLNIGYLITYKIGLLHDVKRYLIPFEDYNFGMSKIRMINVLQQQVHRIKAISGQYYDDGRGNYFVDDFIKAFEFVMVTTANQGFIQKPILSHNTYKQHCGGHQKMTIKQGAQLDSRGYDETPQDSNCWRDAAWSYIPSYISGEHPMYFPCDCKIDLINAVSMRQLKAVNYVKTKDSVNLFKFLHENLNKLLPITQTTVMSYGEWIDHLIKEKKRPYEGDGWWLNLNTIFNRGWHKRSIAFLKKEPHFKTPVIPRHITGRSQTQNIELGKYVYTASKILSGLWNDEQQEKYCLFDENKADSLKICKNIIYAGGKNRDQLGEIINKVSKKFKKINVVSTDYSKYDAHIDEVHQLVEHEVYHFLFPDCPDFHKLLKTQLFTKGQMANLRENIRVLYEVFSTRGSGDQNTSIGNSIINIIMQLYCLNQQFDVFNYLLNDKLVIIFMGDDTLMLMDDYTIDQVKYESAMFDIGMEVKVTISDIENCKFLSGRFIPCKRTFDDYPTYLHVPLLGRWIQKFGVSIHHYPTQQLVNGWIYANSLNYRRMLSPMPLFTKISDWCYNIVKNEDRKTPKLDWTIPTSYDYTWDDRTLLWLDHVYHLDMPLQINIISDLIKGTKFNHLNTIYKKYASVFEYIIDADFDRVPIKQNQDLKLVSRKDLPIYPDYTYKPILITKNDLTNINLINGGNLKTTIVNNVGTANSHVNSACAAAINRNNEINATQPFKNTLKVTNTSLLLRAGTKIKKMFKGLSNKYSNIKNEKLDDKPNIKQPKGHKYLDKQSKMKEWEIEMEKQYPNLKVQPIPFTNKLPHKGVDEYPHLYNSLLTNNNLQTHNDVGYANINMDTDSDEFDDVDL
jgi:hypothetical protein